MDEEDNIRALEEEVFNINLPPVNIVDPAVKNFGRPKDLTWVPIGKNRLGKWKEGYVQDTKKAKDISTDDLIKKV